MKINHYHTALREEAGDAGEGGGGTTTTTAPATTTTTTPAPTKITDAPGGGTPTGWKAQLSDEFKTHPLIKDFKETPDGLNALTKSLLHSQSMIGKNKVAVPTDKSTPEEVEAFLKASGRPDSPEGYDIKLPQDSKLPVDEEKLKSWKTFFHKSGLSNKQANDILNQYVSSVGGEMQMSEQQFNQEIESGMLQLRQTWGDNYDSEVDIAKAAVKKFGDDDLVKWLDETGNTSHPRFVKLFNSIGKAMMSDSPSGDGFNKFITDSTKAVQEINALKQDKEFLNTLTNKTAPGHKEAKDRWFELQGLAYPSKSA